MSMASVLKTMATYGALWTASDITQELVISQKDHVDWGKTARVATTGACVIAPLIHNWFHLVELLFPGNAVKSVLKKVAADQICLAPVGISSFYLATNALEGKNGIPELKAKFKRTYLTGMMFWPVIHVFNFRFVRHHYKPLTSACASFIWTIFLCFMKEETGVQQMQQPCLASKASSENR